MRPSPANPAVSRVLLEGLAGAIQDRLEAQGVGAAVGTRRGGGLRPQVFGGAIGVGVHEWFVPGVEGASPRCGPGSALGCWSAPLGVVMEVARGAVVLAGAGPGAGVGPGAGALCVWVGRGVWPYPGALARGTGSLLERSLFVDPGGKKDRAWALELALRSAGVAVVVADAQRLSFTESRRLQLAAEAGGTLGLLLRPGAEMSELSAAQTRWLVAPAPSPDADQRWTVELLRRKGLRPIQEGARRWAAHRSHATGDVRVAPDVSDRPAEAEASAARRIG